MAIENRGLLPSRTRAGTSNWPPVFLWVPGLLVAAAMALPLAYLVLRTLGTGGDAWDLLFRMRVLETLGRTVFLALAVTGACIAIAVPLAWITVRTDLPFRRVWSVLTILPLVIPSYVGGFVVVAALGPKGMLQGFLAGPLGVERLPEIYGLPGATLTLALLSYPYVLLSVRAGLWGLDPALEEASRSLGYSRRVTFFRVVLPQLKPAIAAGALLVALYTLSDFGAVSLLRYEVFTYVIYLQYDVGARTLAAASSLVLVVLALGILAFEGRTRSRSPYYRSTVGAVRPQTAVRLGRWRWPAFAFCGLVVTLSMVMPIAILGYSLGRGVMAGQSLGLEWSTIANSMYVSVLAALAAVLAAIPLAVLTVRYAGRISALLERITYVGFALPGIVIALAVVYFGANYAVPLYQNLVLLVFAYVVLYLPAAIGAVRSSLLQVSPRVEEAARSLGKAPYQVLGSVTVPLVRPGILAGGALVFLITMKELPATLILAPIGFKTLATSIWSAAEAAFFAQAAAPALLLILASSVPLAFLMLMDGRLGRLSVEGGMGRSKRAEVAH